MNSKGTSFQRELNSVPGQREQPKQCPKQFSIRKKTCYPEESLKNSYVGPYN